MTNDNKETIKSLQAQIEIEDQNLREAIKENKSFEELKEIEHKINLLSRVVVELLKQQRGLTDI
jgi:flagellar biosynthesis chaperone FliJ